MFFPSCVLTRVRVIVSVCERVNNLFTPPPFAWKSSCAVFPGPAPHLCSLLKVSHGRWNTKLHISTKYRKRGRWRASRRLQTQLMPLKKKNKKQKHECKRCLQRPCSLFSPSSSGGNQSVELMLIAVPRPIDPAEQRPLLVSIINLSCESLAIDNKKTDWRNAGVILVLVRLVRLVKWPNLVSLLGCSLIPIRSF